MANNARQYGFRWSTNYNGMSQPQIIEMAVDSGANFNVSGNATNLNLTPGDPVRLTSTGCVQLCGGNENAQTSQPIWGIVVGIGGQGYFSGLRMTRSQVLPSGVSYGTSIDRQSKVLCVPASAGNWECDVDDNVTAVDYFGYQALINENVDHRLIPNGSGYTNNNLSANPLLNIASHSPSNGALGWRVLGVSQNLTNQDLSGQNVKLVVTVNKGAEPFYTNIGT